MTQTAMILAAGRGERMRPLTDQVPKPLLKVRGKPLLQYHLEGLQEAGFSRVVINHAWLGKQIEDFAGDGSQFGLKIEYSAEAEALETLGGIRKALPLLTAEEPSGCFAVVNGDVFTSFRFARLHKAIEQMKTRGATAHLVMVDNPEHHPQGDFGLIDGLLSTTTTPRLTFSGLSVYHKDFFKDVAEGKQPLAPRLREVMAKNKVTGEYFAGEWNDVGTPERLAALDNGES